MSLVVKPHDQAGETAAEGLALLERFEFVELADRKSGLIIGAKFGESSEDLGPEGVVEVARPVAGNPADLDQSEDGVARLTPGVRQVRNDIRVIQP